MGKYFKLSQVATDRKDPSLTLYFKDVRHLSRITQEEEVELARKIQKGDKKAEEELIKANLRFVITVAKQYQNNGLDLVDLIQEGNLGLVRCAHKFNPDKGYRFISYAVWWIRQAILQAISNKCRTVRMPMSQVLKLNVITSASKKFEQEHERVPTAEELSEIVEMDPVKISQTQTANTKPLSLESPLKQEDDVSCLLDVLPNDDIPVEENLENQDLANRLEYVLKKLPTRDSDILRMIFGIGVAPMTKEQVSKKFGISAERVRQISHSALNRIRENYKDKLEDLL